MSEGWEEVPALRAASATTRLNARRWSAAALTVQVQSVARRKLRSGQAQGALTAGVRIAVDPAVRQEHRFRELFNSCS